MRILDIFNNRKMLEKITTAKYPNRIRDKKKIESLLGLKEIGNNLVEFYSKKNTLLFVGYDRIVYGDHGPYVEFNKDQLVATVIQKFNTKTPLGSYYEWQTVNDGSDVKIYWQLRDVKNLPNPPAGGFRGNRQEGYADYIPFKYYVSPYELIVKRINNDEERKTANC